MKIAFVTGFMKNGGAERVLATLANEFSLAGCQVSVLAIIDGEDGYRLNEAVNFVANASTDKNRFRRVLQRWLFLRNQLKAINPDLVISFCTEINIYSILACSGLSPELVICERNDPYNDPPGKITRALRRMTYPFCDGYVFQTKEARGYFSKKICDKGVILPNPLKDGLILPFRGERAHRVVSVARLHSQKNLTMLIEAFSIFAEANSDYVLELYGDGPQRGELERLVQELDLGEKVIFKGFCSQVDIEIKNAAMFVLFSDYEGVPNSLLEAMALGLPVIAADCPSGGPRAYVQSNFNGLLVEPRNIEDLTSAMAKIAQDGEFASRIGERASCLRDELNSKNVAKQWYQYCESVVKDAR